ncbi:type II toxin-antitoxin system HicA family toxin [Leptolyngbyaceae cyanobacterium UHCC 1019]
MSSQWSATKAKRVLAALRKIGWRVKRKKGSHKILERDGWADFTFAFHDGEEVGPRMLAKIAEKTGITPDDI